MMKAIEFYDKIVEVKSNAHVDEFKENCKQVKDTLNDIGINFSVENKNEDEIKQEIDQFITNWQKELTPFRKSIMQCIKEKLIRLFTYMMMMMDIKK